MPKGHGLNLKESKYCHNVEAITQSDLASSITDPFAIYVGVTGDVKIIPDNVAYGDAISGTDLKSSAGVTFKNAVQGSVLGGDTPILAKAVFNTGTTATDLVKLLETA